MFELIVVMLIMSVGMGLFLGLNSRQLKEVELQAQGQAVVHLMQAAKSTAIVQGKNNRCMYDPAKRLLRTTLDGRQKRLAPGVELRVGDRKIGQEAELALFYADGSAVAESIQLRSHERSLTIEVDSLFGRVRLAEG